MSGPTDAASVNRAELAALDHAHPHLDDGYCGCNCEACLGNGDWACICAECRCNAVIRQLQELRRERDEAVRLLHENPPCDELAALDHDEPHLYEGQCGCSCPECVTPIGRCVCLDCGCS